MHIILKTTLHLFFWVIYSGLAAGLSFNIADGPDYLLKNINVFIINYIWALIAFYVVYIFAYKLLEQKKFAMYFFMVIGWSVFLTTFFMLLYKFVCPEVYNISDRLYYTSLPGTFILANCGSLLKGFISWFDTAQKKSELEKRSLMHELESLKSQVNPHFLFNTLNNIDSLIHIDTEKASKSLLKLSNILRYMLYGANQKEVLLQKEAEHLLNIVELQKLRWSNKDAIVFKAKGIISDIYVAPLIFSPFVENAFKYALKDVKEKAVEINLKWEKNIISFYCRNYYDTNDKNQDDSVGGIGLKNVKRRLELLYNNRYSLKINNENGIFEVDLKITK